MAEDSATATAPATNGAPTATTTAPEIDWRSYAPDDVKGDLKSLESIKDLPGLIKTAIHGQKALGTAIRLPGKDAKPDELTKARTETMAKLRDAGLLDSAPATPADYVIERPDFAAAVGWDEGAESAFRTKMHAAGASNAQVQAAVAAYVDMTLAQLQAEKAERGRVQAELQREWGPNYKPNLGLANKAVQTLDQEIGAKGELIGYLQTVGAADHPLMVKAMAWMGRSMWEHGVIDGVAGEVGMEEAAAKLSAMQQDKNHPLNNRTHPDHKAAIDEALALHNILNRGGR